MDLSIVIATLNRAALLRESLVSLLAQDADGIAYEIVVVDNGSTDGTEAVAGEFAGTTPVVRYLREPQRGIVHARNAGIAAAQAPILAFFDDDQEAVPGWVSAVVGTFRSHPEVDFIAGRVQLASGLRPPAWITSATRGALGVIDRGDRPREITSRQWMCCGGGNMACRRRVLDEVGWFSPECPRSQDRELTVRLLFAGKQGRYVPEMLALHKVDPARLTRQHVRRWNLREGHVRAGYQFEELFTREGILRWPPPQARTFAGVPLFLYRAFAAECLRWIGATVRGDRVAAFTHEARALYYGSYIRRRQQITARMRVRTMLSAARRAAAAVASYLLGG